MFCNILFNRVNTFEDEKIRTQAIVLAVSYYTDSSIKIQNDIETFAVLQLSKFKALIDPDTVHLTSSAGKKTTEDVETSYTSQISSDSPQYRNHNEETEPNMQNMDIAEDEKVSEQHKNEYEEKSITKSFVQLVFALCAKNHSIFNR